MEGRKGEGGREEGRKKGKKRVSGKEERRKSERKEEKEEREDGRKKLSTCAHSFRLPYTDFCLFVFIWKLSYSPPTPSPFENFNPPGITVRLPGGCQVLCSDHTPTTIINAGAGTGRTTAASNPWLSHSICLQVNLSFAVTLWYWPFLASGEMWFIFGSVIGADETERRREVSWGFLKPM